HGATSPITTLITTLGGPTWQRKCTSRPATTSNRRSSCHRITRWPKRAWKRSARSCNKGIMPKAQLQYLTEELDKLREQKLYQKLRVLETEQLPVSRFDGREVINLSSNNYLGLTTHPKLRARALEA